MITKNKSYFLDFPETARLWVFMAERNLTSNEAEWAKKAMEHFVPQWQAHGNALLAKYELIENRFIVIAVDESQADASGCSIDSMTRYIKSMEKELQLSFTNRMLIAYKEGEEIKSESLASFKAKVKSGELAPDTLIYDNSVSNLYEFKEKWGKPISESWAKNLVP